MKNFAQLFFALCISIISVLSAENSNHDLLVQIAAGKKPIALFFPGNMYVLL